VSCLTAITPSPELRARAQEEEATAFPPSDQLSALRASSEGMEAMARDVKETRRQFLQEARSQDVWWESQPGLLADPRYAQRVCAYGRS
jgi:hypothetical protein